MKTLVPILLVAVAVTTGCASSSPTRVEQYVFDVQTNSVPVVTNWTETVTATNVLPTGEKEVTVRHVVNWATNIESQVVYTISTNGAAIADTAKRVTNLFAPGFGELAGATLLGILAAWAKLRSSVNRGKAGNVALAQGIETLLAIIETTPQGATLTGKLKLELAKGQRTAGVLQEIASIVETHVDNDQAKRAARLILDSLPKPTGAS